MIMPYHVRIWYVGIYLNLLIILFTELLILLIYLSKIRIWNQHLGKQNQKNKTFIYISFGLLIMNLSSNLIKVFKNISEGVY